MTKPLVEETLRIAHLSDFHCSQLTLNPFQFLSKRWLGNINLLFNRSHVFIQNLNRRLIPFLQEHKAECVFISGDLTSTSQISEFIIAYDLVLGMRHMGMKVFVVPGNHDNYTRQAYRNQTFHQFFDEPTPALLPVEKERSLLNNRVSVRKINPNWWWIGLDTTEATPLISSRGRFDEKMEANLEDTLHEIPSEGRVILVNHYPFLDSRRSQHNLLRSSALREQLKRWPKIKLYLHGHIHAQSIKDLREEGLPIVLNSGSCSLQKNGSCHLIDLSPEGCLIQVFNCSSDKRGRHNVWAKKEELSFKL